MKKMTRSVREPIGAYRVIEDFLPSPEHLAFKEEKVKVTIALSKASVDFFKKESKKHRTQYQTMIRRLLDYYIARQQERPRTGKAFYGEH
jgi:predicted DNA binding CopG/RHH family protein